MSALRVQDLEYFIREDQGQLIWFAMPPVDSDSLELGFHLLCVEVGIECAIEAVQEVRADAVAPTFTHVGQAHLRERTLHLSEQLRAASFILEACYYSSLPWVR